MRDLIGQQIGRLTVTTKTDKRSSGGNVVWVCICTCGKVIEVRSGNLISGNTKSCGCLQREVSVTRMCAQNPAIRKYEDGERDTSLYHIWESMRARCSNPNHRHYHRYGGHGIKICDGWDDYRMFKAWSICHGYHEGCGFSIDRIDNDGNYEPENCQWLTNSENVSKRWQDQKKKLVSKRFKENTILDGIPTASA